MVAAAVKGTNQPTLPAPIRLPAQSLCTPTSDLPPSDAAADAMLLLLLLRRRRRRLQGGAGWLGGWEAGDAGGLCSTFLNKLSNRRGCCCCIFYVKLKVSHARAKPAF